MPKVPYSYEVNGKLVTGNGALIPICSLANRSLLPSLTVPASKKKRNKKRKSFPDSSFLVEIIESSKKYEW